MSEYILPEIIKFDNEAELHDDLPVSDAVIDAPAEQPPVGAVLRETPETPAPAPDDDMPERDPSLPPLPDERTGRRTKARTINFTQISRLASLMLREYEIAAALGMSRSWWQQKKREYPKQFKEALQNGYSMGKSSLRRKQYSVAVDEGDTKMLIWLGKQYLDQKDKIETDNSTNAKVVMTVGVEGVEPSGLEDKNTQEADTGISE